MGVFGLTLGEVQEEPSSLEGKSKVTATALQQGQEEGESGQPRDPTGGHGVGETFHVVPLGLLFSEALKCNI